jgi:hypothetical protein
MLSGRIKRLASYKTILPAFLLFITVLILMLKGPFGSERIKELSAGLGTLDMRFLYSPSDAAELFERLGAAGRQTYTRLLTFDFAFLMSYMMMQSLLISALIRKANLPERWNKLNLLPILRSLLDAIENCLLLVLLTAYPAQYPAMAVIASVFTTVKLGINYAYIALVFSLGAISTRASMMKKITMTKETRQTI